MKVAYVVSRFPKLTETFVLYEMLAVREQGVDVVLCPLIVTSERVTHPEAETFLANIPGGPLFSAETLLAQWHFLRQRPADYLRVWWEVLRGTWGSANFFFGALGTVPRAVAFARALAGRDVDHVHAHFATHPAVAALVIHRLLGVPYSFTAHAHDLFVDQQMLREKVGAAAFVVVISDFNREFIIRHCGEAVRDKIAVVRCGVDTALFQPQSDSNGVWMARPFTIVCVGSLEERKGQTDLVEACRLLSERGIDFRCHLIGEGPQRDLLRRQIADAGLGGRVYLEGGCRRNEVLASLHRADVSVLPSVVTSSGRSEGIPVSLMEAMACGVPVVSSRISGIPELIRHEETGLLVPPGSPTTLAETLARLYDDAGLRRRLGQAGRDLVLQEYDQRRNAAALARFFAKKAVSGQQSAVSGPRELSAIGSQSFAQSSEQRVHDAVAPEPVPFADSY
ncbi:MAG: glycosyltransferase family 4 protein [Chloroflexi bacterium]|nr:glycosyltransferase family 4 protein [Chloroflexota bacterium]